MWPLISVIAGWVLIGYIGYSVYLWLTAEKTKIHYVCPCGFYEEPKSGKVEDVRMFCPYCGLRKIDWSKEIRKWHRDVDWFLIDHGYWEVYFRVDVEKRIG